jgi:GAF domain-containing protein
MPPQAQHLEALSRAEILETPLAEVFDRIARLATGIFAVPIATISLFEEARAWMESRYGLDLLKIPPEWDFMAHTPPEDCVRIIKDARADVRFASVPLVTGPPHVRFYASAPLVSRDGYKLGALCILDTAVRAEFEIADWRTLADLADMTMDAIELRTAGRATLERLATLSRPRVVR